MNYLAHLALSDEHPEIMVGNLMGDFITRKQIEFHSLEFKQGYDLHLFIDNYTDKHKVVDEICLLFKSTQDKYTPVVVDIIFDYYLFRNWKKYYSLDFSLFENLAYNSILDRKDLLPDKIAYRLERMIDGRFIDSYKSLDALVYVLDRMDKRARFPSNFKDAILTITENDDFINENFNKFYLELKSETDSQLINLRSEMKS